MPIVNALPNTITNGQLVDAVPVMANFNWLVSQVNGNACPATSGSGVLKGNGTGGTSTAVAGTDYAGIGSANTFTALQSGIAATAAANFPITSQVQQSSFNTGASGGTADAITVTFTPTITSLTSAPIWWRATAANATTTPTLKRDGLVAKTIVKGANQALVAGDIPGAGAWMCSQYDVTLDKEVLLNPAYAIAIPSATTSQLGVVTKSTPTENLNGTGTGVVASANLPTAVAALPAGLGVGQTWTDVKASRVSGYTYTNTGSRSIMVSVSSNSSVNATTSTTITVGGVTVASQLMYGQSAGVTTGTMSACAVIPPGASYVVTCAPSVGTWAELS